MSSEDTLYNVIACEHMNMSHEMRANVVAELKAAMEKYEQNVLMEEPVRNHIYQLYQVCVLSDKAVSYFSRRFNMSHKGRNAQISDEVDRHVHAAFEADQSGDAANAIDNLLKVELRHSVLYSPTVLHIINEYPALVAQAERVNELQTLLYRSVVKMAAGIAKIEMSNLSGDVIEYSDVAHEALIAADRAVKAYQPMDDGATFTSYVNRFVTGAVSNFIAESTRTVVLPRTVLDRHRPVREAIAELEHSELTTVAKKATEILAKKRRKSRDKALSPGEVYTPEEVQHLIGTTQEIASLDIEVAVDDFNHPATLIDIIEDEGPSPEEQYDVKYTSDALMEVIKTHCNNEEYEIMMIRWGMGAVRGLKETADVYKRNTRRPMNKGKVASIERIVFDRVRNDERLLEVKEVIESLG